MLVLLGGVMQVSAWNHVYLNDDWNSWGGNSDRSHEFTCSDPGTGNNFYIDLNTDELLKLRTDDYHFRFYVSDSGHWSPKNDNDVISTTDYANCEQKESGSFKIPQNAHAKSARISLSYNNSTDNTWKWHVTATITTYSGTTNVGYMNVSGKTEIDPKNVYAYAWDDNGLLILGAWPGTKMTANSDGTYSLSDVDFVANDMKIIFNNGKSQDSGEQVKTETMTFADNKVYNFTEAIGNQTIGISSYGCNTYSCAYPLEFPEGDGDDVLKAFIITGIGSNGQLIDTRVYKVPAGTGLFITGTQSKSDYSVPVSPKTKDNVSSNMMVAGTGGKVYQTAGDYTNFILTTNNGKSSTPKFYMVNSNSAGMTVSAGKAYLQILTETVTTSSRDFFWFDNETTGIDKVDVNANDNFDANAPIYNLAGQRVSKNYKGVVIVNGKKVVIK